MLASVSIALGVSVAFFNMFRWAAIQDVGRDGGEEPVTAGPGLLSRAGSLHRAGGRRVVPALQDSHGDEARRDTLDTVCHEGRVLVHEGGAR